MDTEFCLMLFLHPLRWSHIIFFFSLLIWWITLILFQYYASLPSWDELPWSWCIILLIYCWIWFDNTLLGIWGSMFMQVFFSYNGFVWFQYQDNAGLIKWVSWDFPGGAVLKTPCSQCRGPGFDPWLGN